MSDQTNRVHLSDDELPPQGAHRSSTPPLSSEQALDIASEHKDDDLILTLPRSPSSRILIPTYAQAVLRHHIALHRFGSLPRNERRINLHQPSKSLEEEGDGDTAVEGHLDNNPPPRERTLPRSEGMMNLHEPRGDLQQEEEEDQDEEAANPAALLVRSPRMWNLHEVQEVIRQNEENGYDSPTPPPAYQQAILMPPYEPNGGQTSQQVDVANHNEAQHEQPGRPRLFHSFRRLDSPDAPTGRISNPASRIHTLTRTPPPPYRSPSEHLINRSMQDQDRSSRSDAREREAHEVTEDARDLTIESRDLLQQDGENND